MVYFLTFVLAFCSVVYELLLGQTLSAFLGNTVLRYSVTIGLYMLSMGIGALLVKGRLLREPVVSLQWVELALALSGGFCLALLFMVDFIGTPLFIFSLLAHGLIIVIGILTGVEIPLLIEIRNREKKESVSSVLGVDYIGAFAGTIAFAFLFYPVVGLTQSAFIVATLNAGIGMLLVSQHRAVSQSAKKSFRKLLAAQAGLLVLLLAAIWRSEEITQLFLSWYLQV